MEIYKLKGVIKMSNEEKLTKVGINWVRRIYGKLPKSIENTDILTLNILHILIKL